MSAAAAAPPTWRVGAVTITAVVETTTALDPEFVRRHVVPEATRDHLAGLPWLAPHWVDERGEPRMVTQALVVRSRARVIVVDTCIGNDKDRRNPAFHRLATPFLADLTAVVDPAAVDVVLCTHLHFDHVGWNTRWDGARWVPTFPRARYLFARRELEHWSAIAGHGYVMSDSIRPVLDAGLVDLVEVDHVITDEVALEPTPGHTPGHVSVRIRSGGESALITGDAIHHPCQVAHPAWGGPADSDRGAAAETRARLVHDAARDGALVIGTHFAHPAAGRVVADAGGAEGDPAPPGHRLAPVFPNEDTPG